MPIHALAGRRLEVIGSRKDPQRGLYVVVQHPDGGGIALPISWTDVDVVDPALTLQGESVRLDPGALVDLARTLECLEGEKLDRVAAGSTLKDTVVAGGNQGGPSGMCKPRTATERPATAPGGRSVGNTDSHNDSVQGGGRS